MAKKWQQEEIAELKRSAGKHNLEELAETFGTDAGAIQTKLEELGLEASHSLSKSWYADPQVDRYEAAVKLVQQGNWAKAQKALTELLANVDVPEVAARARQMLKVCEARTEGGPGVAEDPFLEAVYLKNHGQLDEALQICAKGGRQTKEERFAYLAASVHALSGQVGKAAEALKKAVELNPKNRVYAYHDPDFEPVLGQPELQELFGSL